MDTNAIRDFSENCRDLVKIVTDMTSELSVTFPEHAHLWNKWLAVNLDELPHKIYIKETEFLYAYCKKICTDQFYCILYQNNELFATPGRALFLPDVDFSILFYSEGVTKDIRTAIWNYLKLISLTVSKNDILNPETSSLSNENIDEKIADAARDLDSFFNNLSLNQDEDDDGELIEHDEIVTEPPPILLQLPSPPPPTPTPSSPLPPNMSIPDFAMNGKLGALAQDVANEIGGDFAELLGMFGSNENCSISDIMQQLMKNPSKLASLVQTVSGKLTDKVNSGDITNDELMREATQIMSSMNSSGSPSAPFQDILKSVSQTMASVGAGGAIPAISSSRTTGNTWSEKVKQRAANKKNAAALAAISTQKTAVSSQSTPPSITDTNTCMLDDILSAALADSVGPANIRKKRENVEKVKQKKKA